MSEQVTPGNDPSLPATEIQVGDVKADTVNIAGGHIIQVAAGGTLVMGSQAGAGIQALNHLVQANRQLWQAAAAFTADFESACAQVDVLADYKSLHDLLHQVQFHCYEPILLESGRFPEESSLDALDSYRRNLNDILMKLEKLIANQRLLEGDTNFMSELSQSQVELGQATDSLEPAALKKAVWRLKRVLATQPARINARLISSARLLRLSSLLNALQQIQTELAGAEFPTAQRASFETGLTALGQLNLGLEALLNEHDLWQSVDVELRRIESLIEQDLVELEMSWDDLKRQTQKLWLNLGETAAGLEKASAQLEQALQAGSQDGGQVMRTRRAFRAFRREAGSRFFQVDVNLHHFCDELRLIGAPLNHLLQNLNNS